MSKIPCSVGILTLNSGSVLRRCLESIKDCAEIVICDGNSTDDTLAIAREYGCKIIKQYDSDEPNLRCERDKANMRNKALDASSYDWHIYLDSDDALSKEVMEEVRIITNDPSPQFLVYRMPLQIVLADTKVIQHSSNYPYIQLRLFNKKTGARFRGHVHERITFDTGRYPTGLLKGYYINHWPQSRMNRIFAHMAKYATWEAEIATCSTIIDYFFSLRQSLRSSARVILVSVWNYTRYGFSDSMPPRVEIARLYYQLYLLWLMTKKYLSHR
jgi:glycosyltransferase involved in cell wall biosynthesis